MRSTSSLLWCSAVFFTVACCLPAQTSQNSPGGDQNLAAKSASTGDNGANKVAMFDGLRNQADVIYLIANSSLVFGPDPKGRSEEVTFIGLVTVPKWPMKSYGRRTLPDGREQIDIELTQSDLAGESYMLDGPVYLGEHPELRSLGTITESVEAARQRGIALAPQRAVQGQGVAVTVALTRDLESTIGANPDVLWDQLVSKDLRELSKQADQIKSGAVKPRFIPPATAASTSHTFYLDPDVAARFKAFAATSVSQSAWIHDTVQTLVSDLQTKDVLVHPGTELIRPSVIPNDFVVARKVLITTAKGILYNETPVPVRGKLTSIPPVFTSGGADGVNVFKGMELPVPLLDKDKNVDGWFYSKAHMAYSVRPDKVERGTLEGDVVLRSGDKTETVTLRGPIEIHHGKTQSAADGSRETHVEVMILALRGTSKLLGGPIMAIEAFSDRDKFSQGRIAWQDGASGSSSFDLFLDVYTPSEKISNYDPIRIAGTFSSFADAGKLEKGSLSIPIVQSRGEYASAGGTAVPLLNEAERPVVSVETMRFHVLPRGPETRKF
jgi:hypothetical protein